MRQPRLGDKVILFSRVERFVCTPEGRQRIPDDVMYQQLTYEVALPCFWPSVPKGLGVWVLTLDVLSGWVWQALVSLEREKDT